MRLTMYARRSTFQLQLAVDELTQRRLQDAANSESLLHEISAIGSAQFQRLEAMNSNIEAWSVARAERHSVPGNTSNSSDLARRDQESKIPSKHRVTLC